MGKQLESLPRFTRALMKSHLLTSEIAYKDIEKPIIAIANSWNELNHGHIPQKEIAQKVKYGIYSQGGLPLEFNTIAPCDAFAQGYEGMNYILPSREIIADSVEAFIRSQNIFDGIVFISSCDKITPGMLMAALRLNIPCIHICSGTCIPEISFAESKKVRNDFLSGKIDEEKFAKQNAKLYSHPGICPYIGTANTMDIFAEVLGLALSGSATIPASTSRRSRYAIETGKTIVGLARKNILPTDIVNKKSFDNALIVLAALSGSMNHLLHVPAIADEINIKVDFDYIGNLNSKTPQLCAINPNGPYSIADLDKAGGIPAVMKELRNIIDLDCINVEGLNFGQITENARVKNSEIIHSFNNPISKEGGVVILKGNIAKEGAVVRLGTVPEGMMEFSGAAVVFNSEDEATEAIENNKVRDDSIVVIRYEGPKGGPGMREMHRISGALKRIGQKIAIITDGRFSGATGGLAIGYLSPEAAQGGEIGIIQNGDEITIDIKRKSLNVNLSDEEIKTRMKNYTPKKNKKTSKLLTEYAKRVGSTSTGAVLQ